MNEMTVRRVGALFAAVVLCVLGGCSPMNEVVKQLDACELAAARAALSKCTDDDVRSYVEGHPGYARLGGTKAEIQGKIGAAQSMLRMSTRFRTFRATNEASAMSTAVDILETEKWGGGWTALLCDLDGIVSGAERYVEQQIASIESRLLAAEQACRWYDIESIESRYSLGELAKSGRGSAGIGRILDHARERRVEAERLYAEGFAFEEMLKSGGCRDLETAWGCIDSYTNALRVAPELDQRKGGLEAHVSQLIRDRAQIVEEHFVQNLREARRIYNRGGDPSSERGSQLQEARTYAAEALCIAKAFEHVVLIGTKEAEHLCDVVDMAAVKNDSYVANIAVRARRGVLLSPETAGLGIPITGRQRVGRGQSKKWQGSALLPRPDHELLRPEDVYGLETDLPPDYVIDYLSNQYSDRAQAGVGDVLSPTPPDIDRNGRRHYMSTDYDGGDFYLQVRNSQGSTDLFVRCVVYEQLM